MPSKQLSLETIEHFLRCDILSQSNLNQIWEKKKGRILGLFSFNYDAIVMSYTFQN